MDRNQAKEFYPILQAYAEERVIECRTKPSAVKGKDIPNDWTEIKEIGYLDNIEYRVKPEPKYRPFKDTEECWTEMLKHQPFGWIKPKSDDVIGKFMLIDSLMNRVVTVRTNVRFKYYELLEHYTFADGFPFGVKVGE